MAIKVRVGTSGFAYPWNPDGLEWYLKESKLDCLELNASFYRFPFTNQIENWKKKTEEYSKDFRWIIKANRLITHVYKFGPKALSAWNKFSKLFEPLEPFIDFYLFQLPPFIKSSMNEKIREFIKNAGIEEKAAVEARNIDWFENYDKLEGLNTTIVSIDAPELPRRIFNANGVVYERIHGRRIWYSYRYSKKELKSIALNIKQANPKKAYILFNNDHDMLDNAREMKRIIEG
ncbi:MAG: DUF72 domain-containing protein [Candidatus Micrarchaeia archaeon]